MNNYPLSVPDEAELTKRFTYHPPQGDQIDRYTYLRDLAHHFATEICQQCPVGRERSIALTKLDDVVMWANAAIARGEVPLAPAPDTGELPIGGA